MAQTVVKVVSKSISEVIEPKCLDGAHLSYIRYPCAIASTIAE